MMRGDGQACQGKTYSGQWFKTNCSTLKPSSSAPVKVFFFGRSGQSKRKNVPVERFNAWYNRGIMVLWYTPFRLTYFLTDGAP